MMRHRQYCAGAGCLLAAVKYADNEHGRRSVRKMMESERKAITSSFS